MVPNPKNLFEWNFVIYNLKDCAYEGGYYHGKLLFPTDYPMKPPGILMVTPSGRFEVKKRICLSISDYHPETWNPAWNAESIIVALISFMTSEELTTGCIRTSYAQKQQYAKLSLSHNMGSSEFRALFKDQFGKLEIKTEKIQESKKFEVQKQNDDRK